MSTGVIVFITATIDSELIERKKIPMFILLFKSCLLSILPTLTIESNPAAFRDALHTKIGKGKKNPHKVGSLLKTNHEGLTRQTLEL